MQSTPRIILSLDTSRGFDRRALAGIARYASLNGPWTFYHRPPGYLAHGKTPDLRDLKAWHPDGIICSMAHVKALRRMGLPIVGFDPDDYSGAVPCVDSDHAEVGRRAARHLLDLGHRNLAFCGYNELRWSRERCRAFCCVAKEAGAQVDVYRHQGRQTSWPHEESHVQAWVRSLPKPVGMFCVNDDRAITLMDTCRTLEYGVPEDISILGADDDTSVCLLQNPPLSSVRIASDHAGFEAARLMHHMLEGKARMAGQRIIAPVTGVAARQSTDVLMVGNEEVRKALRFIRENVNRPVQVSDVVDCTALSHRSLNEQFHAALGCSIVKQLTRARIDHISRLLTDTDMRIHEIATAVGYEDDRHFARYFKRATSLTPREYRTRMSQP